MIRIILNVATCTLMASAVIVFSMVCAYGAGMLAGALVAFIGAGETVAAIAGVSAAVLSFFVMIGIFIYSSTFYGPILFRRY